MSQQTENTLRKKWDVLRKNVSRSTSVPKENPSEKAERIKRLEANHEQWFEYYFPNYYTSKPNKFHIEASNRFIQNKRHYEIRAWSRELAKSTRARMETIYLAMTKQIHNVLIVSNSHDNAERQLAPFKILFESNQRLINDYGKQVNPGNWTSSEITTLGGVKFRAIGEGESPRGDLNENFRPEVILIDDFDTDEECRNKDIITKKFKWLEGALLPTISVSGSYRILFNGNIISKDCCLTRAMKRAKYVDVVNIRNADGKSSWPEKNSEADIDEFLSMFSYSIQQQEFFNNPITEGTVFKEMHWGVCPDLNKMKYVVAYGDPAPSNKENGKGSFKSVFLIGRLDNKFYVYTGFLEHPTNNKFVEWFYSIDDYVNGKTQIYFCLENNSLQDPFFEQVFIPLFKQTSTEKGKTIPISPDTRKKPDKYVRIEGNLEPLNRKGDLILNIEEKGNPNMERLEEQFKAIEPGLPSPADGPDCIEGGVYILNNKQTTTEPIHTVRRNPSSNKNRF